MEMRNCLQEIKKIIVDNNVTADTVIVDSEIERQIHVKIIQLSGMKRALGMSIDFYTEIFTEELSGIGGYKQEDLLKMAS